MKVIREKETSEAEPHQRMALLVPDFLPRSASQTRVSGTHGCTLSAETNFGVRNRTALCRKAISNNEMKKIFLDPEI
jgi:hypothetical protein